MLSIVFICSELGIFTTLPTRRRGEKETSRGSVHVCSIPGSRMPPSIYNSDESIMSVRFELARALIRFSSVLYVFHPSAGRRRIKENNKQVSVDIFFIWNVY